MRRSLLTVLILVLLGAGTPVGAEEIRSFAAEVRLSRDEVFTVTERIEYDFGALSRHGIFRDIPVRYGRGRAADYRIRLDVLGVTDGQGRDLPHQVSSRGEYRRIRIGDPDRVVTGRQVYEITYRVRRGLLYFDDHDEIYWNATGTEWTVPIGRAEARVVLPEGSEGVRVRTACFTGRRGAIASDCDATQVGGTVRFVAARGFREGEGLTLVVGLPKGVVREPSAASRLLARASDYVSAWILLPVVALAGMVHLWRTRGRDPAGAAAVRVSYEPPAGLTPAEVGTILDESADLADITSTILDLAVRGYLEIEQVETTRFLFFSNTDYRLHRRPGAGGTLLAHEQTLLKGLFGDRTEVLVSSLRNEFYKHLPEIKRALYTRLSREGGYFPAAPDRVRRNYLIAGGVLAVLAVVAVGNDIVGFGPGIGLGLAGAIVAAFSPIMPRRSAKGRRVLDEILGFREFVGRVDAGRLERLGGRDAGTFEKVLPYAIVLGVADQWATAFADIYTEPPRWYRSASYSGGFYPRAFVSDVGHSLQTIGATMASSPRGSGGSGFSGGSSGGGFGGGGGGSW
jgi:uncharacterized membrane protein YgcG